MKHEDAAAARHEKIILPPLACPHKQGQPNLYFVHDLTAAWHGYLDEGVDLPPLLPQHQNKHQA